MRMVLFDLGNTLEDGDALLPGALETLESIAALRSGGQPTALLSLVSDFDMPEEPSQIPAIREQYYAILDRLGIRHFFEPVSERVTLSTEVGVLKPDEAVFRAAVAKVDPPMSLDDALFVTENRAHVRAARRIGLRSVHLRGPGQTSGEVERLVDLIPLVRDFAGGDTAGGDLAIGDPAIGDTAVGDFASATAVPGEDTDEIAVFRGSVSACVGIAAAANAAGVGWARLGDEILVYGQSGGVDRAAAAGVDRAVPAGVDRAAAHHVTSHVRETVAAPRLQLVTQNGRTFQQEHPDVPVIVDKGRYLVVDLDPVEAERLNVHHGPCFSVQPLPRKAVVLEAHVPDKTRREPEAWVQHCVDALSRTTFEADLRSLTAFSTRHSTSTEFIAAADWAGAEFASYGYSTRTQPVSVDGAISRNVIAERQGSGSAPRDVVVVTAHLDSINMAGGALAPAPGADDNGSGSAGLLAIARALRDHAPVLDLRLILFGGEEQRLFGSSQYVAGLPQSERGRIRAVVNMDMIGTVNSLPRTVLLEGAALSQSVIDGLAEAAATHTTLAVQTSLNPYNSDHVPFIEKGIPAVLTIEGGDSSNANIHGPNDTLQFIEYDLALDILRMNVAFTATSLGRS